MPTIHLAKFSWPYGLLRLGALRAFLVLTVAAASAWPAAGWAGAIGGGSGSVTRTQLVDAWRERQRRIRSLKITWRQKDTLQKGFWGDPAIDPDITKPNPPKDINVDSSYSVALDEGCVRYELDTQVWSSEDQGLVPDKYVSTFDGETAARHFPSRRGFPTATINLEKSGGDYANVNMRALLLFCRPISPESLGRTPLADFAIQPSKSVIAGRSCLVFEPRSASKSPGGGAVSLYVDPAREFITLRCVCSGTKTTGERFIGYQIDVWYQHDARHGWVPAGWKLIYGVGAQQSGTAKVTDYSVNPKIAPAHFTLTDLPPGTWVTDRRTGKHWVVRQEQPNRPILEAELGVVAYERLLDTEPGEAWGVSSDEWGWFAKLNFVVWLLLGCFLVSVFVYRRLSRRA